MEWQVIVALVLAIPVVLFPAAYVWYLNLGGLIATVRQRRLEGERRMVEKPARVK